MFGSIGKMFFPYDLETFPYMNLIFKDKFPTCYVKDNINQSRFIFLRQRSFIW